MKTRRVATLLKAVLDEQPLTPNDALFLSGMVGDEAVELQLAATVLRNRYKGQVVTFSPKVFVPLTNLCRDFCGYCTFRKAPGEPGARTMSLEDVLDVALRGKRLGCTEVLFSLGDKPEAIYPEMREFLQRAGYRRTLDYLFEACRAVLEEVRILPHSNPGLMGAGDLERLRKVNPSLGLMLENVSDRLCGPTGPHAAAPDKRPAARLKTLEEAGKRSIPFTTGLLIGIGENWEERIASLFALRSLSERFGHIQEVIIQNFRSKPEIPMKDHDHASYDDMSKTIALARLIFGGRMNLQAPPNLTPECYEVYLRSGINDWGGVSPLTLDFINPEAPWPALVELQHRTQQAGFVLKARLPLYPEYILQGERYVAPSLIPYVMELCGPDGLVKGGPDVLARYGGKDEPFGSDVRL